MAIVQVAVVDADGNPLKGVRVAAYDLDNFPAIKATDLTDETGTVKLEHTGPAFYDAFDRRGVSFRDRSYHGKIQIQIISFGNHMNADYVVDSNGFGTHLTLFGASGAFDAAVDSGSSKFIWVCTSHEEEVTGSTALANLSTDQVITVMSGGPARCKIDVSFSGTLFSQAASQPSGARIRFENIGFRATAGVTADFFKPTGGAATVPFDMIAVEFFVTGGGVWRYFADYTGGGSATSSGFLFDRVRGTLNSLANLSSAGAATGPVIIENSDLTLTHLFNRTNSTDFEAGNRYVITDNRLTFSGYAMQQTYFGSSSRTVIMGNHILSTFAGVAFLFGTAASSSVTDITFDNFIECNSANSATRAIRIGTGGVTTAAANVSIKGAFLGPGSLATAVELVTGMTATGCALLISDREWATTISGSTSGWGGSLAHSSLSGLTSGDDHTHYALLSGRSGGQILIGGTGSGDDLGIRSSSHATPGHIWFSADATERIKMTFTLTAGQRTNLQWWHTSGEKFEIGVHDDTDPNDANNHANFKSVDSTTGMITRMAIDFGADTVPVIFPSGTEGVRVSGYQHVGSSNAPTNTTGGDISGIRLHLSAVSSQAAFSASHGRYVFIGGDMTDTSAGAAVFELHQPEIIPASNTSAEFRGLYYQQIINSDTGITLATIQGGYFENRFRQDGAVSEANALVPVAAVIDSSSAATAGTITTARSFKPFLYIRPSGTSTMTITNGYGIDFASTWITGAGLTLTTGRMINIADPGAGTINTLLGIDMAKLTRATTNINFRNAGIMVYTPTTAAELDAAGDTIPHDARIVLITANADLTLTSAPTITDGQNGELLTVINVDTTNAVTIQDQGTLASSNLRLAAATVVLGPRDNITLVYSSTVGDWVQVGHTNVI